MLAKASQRPTLLLVEDDADVRASLEDALDCDEWSVILAVDGLDAIEQMTGGLSPHIMLLDLTMPRLDGYGVLARLRAHTEWCRIPVIVLSADLEVRRVLTLGAVAALSKPADLDVLFATIRRHLPRAEA